MPVRYETSDANQLSALADSMIQWNIMVLASPLVTPGQ
jgi:hypothetical protein